MPVISLDRMVQGGGMWFMVGGVAETQAGVKYLSIDRGVR